MTGSGGNCCRCSRGLAARRDLAVNGDGKVGGAAVWRDYDRSRFTCPLFRRSTRWSSPWPAHCRGLEVHPPGCARADFYPFRRAQAALHHVWIYLLCHRLQPHALAGTGHSAFRGCPEFSSSAAGKLAPAGRPLVLCRQGQGIRSRPRQFDHTNAERLLYHDGPNGQCRSIALRRQHERHVARRRCGFRCPTLCSRRSRTVDDNAITVRFDATSMIIRTPTAFPIIPPATASPSRASRQSRPHHRAGRGPAHLLLPARSPGRE